MDPVTFQLLITTIGGVLMALITFLGVYVKFKEAGFAKKIAEQNERIRALEDHVRNCMETVAMPIPSDIPGEKPFHMRLKEARDYAYSNGFRFTLADVAALIKKYLAEKDAQRKRQEGPGPS